jgi:hypothetical protein
MPGHPRDVTLMPQLAGWQSGPDAKKCPRGRISAAVPRSDK